jgi:tRNA pseudouridine65 synthase
MATFDILYHDDLLVAIHKPPGMLVHRTRLSEDKVFVLQLLRDQLGGAHLFPAHRLDRATSGVLVFGKNAEAATWLGERLMDKSWDKRYLALVRGYFPVPADIIDYPLTDPETGQHEAQTAITHYRVLAQAEQPWPIGLRYPSARFSLVLAMPETGRRQQIRKHFAHLRHPIINDTRHGDVKFNRWFREHELPARLMLHAYQLKLPHPNHPEGLWIQAEPDADFVGVLERVGLANDWGNELARPT